MDHSPIPYNQYVNIGKNGEIIKSYLNYVDIVIIHGLSLVKPPKKNNFPEVLGYGLGPKKIEKTNKYISLGEGVASQESPNIVFVCVFCFFYVFSRCFFWFIGTIPESFSNIVFFGGFLHKIILEDVAGRSWGGDHIYIYIGRKLGVPRKSIAI